MVELMFIHTVEMFWAGAVDKSVLAGLEVVAIQEDVHAI
jgi:hypothetical protein